MDKIAKVRAEIEKRIDYQNKCIQNHYRLTGRAEEEIILEYKQLLAVIDTLQEEPVSEGLEEAAFQHLSKYYGTSIICDEDDKCVVRDFKAGAEWQKTKDQSIIELAEDHAMLAGMEKMKEQMLKDAVDGYVIEDIEEGNGDFLLSADYLPASMGLKDRQKVKVIILKDE